MSAFSSLDVKKINAGGILAFEASSVQSDLKTNLASSDAAAVNESLTVIKTLCEGVEQWIEPYTVTHLPLIMDAFANPKTADAALASGNAILHKSSANSIRTVNSLIYEAFTSMKWQTKKGALVLVGKLGEIYPVVVQRNLPEMILKLIPKL